MKIAFAGDISFDWLGRPGLQATLPELFRSGAVSSKLNRAILARSPYSRFKHSYRLKQATLQARQISENLSHVISASDYFCANLECPLSFRGQSVVDKKYTLRAEPYYLQTLTDLGLTHLSLANNHILDFGPQALSDTTEYLELAGINYFGLRQDRAAQDPAIIETADSRIALLGYVEPGIITPDPDIFLNQRPSPFPLNIDQIINDVSRHSKEAAVIVVLHWGVEWSHLEASYQRELAHQIIDSGAIAVIGHHSHMMGSVEKYREGLIFYSLGNLLMVLPPFAFKKSSKRAIAQLDIRNNKISDYQLLPLDYNEAAYPVRGDFNIDSIKKQYRPDWFPIDETLAFDSFSELKNAEATFSFDDSQQSPPIWSDDFLIIEDIVPLYRLPMGPGWRSPDKRWIGVSTSREFIGQDFLDLNTAYLTGTDEISVNHSIARPPSRLQFVIGYPQALQILDDFACPHLEIQLDGKSVFEFRPTSEMNKPYIREILTPSSGTGKTELKVIIRGAGKKYGLLCWRVLGIA